MIHVNRTRRNVVTNSTKEIAKNYLKNRCMNKTMQDICTQSLNNVKLKDSSVYNQPSRHKFEPYIPFKERQNVTTSL